MSVASGFVDFTTGRYSIVTAPGAGSMAQVKVFNFSLMKPIDHKKRTGPGADQCEPGDNKPAVTNAFMPFGMTYRGGLSLATGWLAGSLGGAERIVVGQLTGPGEVKVYSSGSRLEGGPKIYLAAADHTPVATFAEIASFKPFGGSFRRERRHHQHDDRRRPAGERRLAGGQERAGSEIRAGQT